MRNFLALVTIASCIALTTSTASAQEEGASGFGVGAEKLLLDDFPAAAMFYDTGMLRVDGLLGIGAEGDFLLVGARLLFPVHRAGRADFSLGGGLGLVNIEVPGDDDITNIHLEANGQIRAFLTSNVALTSTLGFGIITGDGDTFALLGQLSGSLGVAYYFY